RPKSSSRHAEPERRRVRRMRVGIDLGTTNSVISYVEEGRAVVIESPDDAAPLVPSLVQHLGDEELLVGRLAKDNFAAHPEQTVWSIKRFIGRGPDEPPGELEILEQARRKVTYTIEDPPSGQGDFVIRLHGKAFSPTSLSAS